MLLLAYIKWHRMDGSQSGASSSTLISLGTALVLNKTAHTKPINNIVWHHLLMRSRKCMRPTRSCVLRAGSGSSSRPGRCAGHCSRVAIQ